MQSRYRPCGNVTPALPCECQAGDDALVGFIQMEPTEEFSSASVPGTLGPGDVQLFLPHLRKKHPVLGPDLKRRTCHKSPRSELPSLRVCWNEIK